VGDLGTVHRGRPWPTRQDVGPGRGVLPPVRLAREDGYRHDGELPRGPIALPRPPCYGVLRSLAGQLQATGDATQALAEEGWHRALTAGDPDPTEDGVRRAGWKLDAWGPAVV